MGLCSAGGEWVRLGGSGLDMVEPSVSAFFGEPLGFQVGLTQGLAFLSSLPPAPFPSFLVCRRTNHDPNLRPLDWGGGGLSAGWAGYLLCTVGQGFRAVWFPDLDKCTNPPGSDWCVSSVKARLMSYLLSCSVCCWTNTGRFLQQQRLDGKIRRRKGTVSRANMESPSRPIIHRRAVCATQAVRDLL